MSVYAELHDGRRLEFPDGTDPAVVQATVKRVLAAGDKPKPKSGVSGLPGPGAGGPAVMAAIKRPIGQAARYGLEGGLGVLDLFATPANMAINAVAPDDMKITKGYGQTIADAIGLPGPDGGIEEAVADVSRAVAGVGGVAKGAEAISSRLTPAAQRVARFLSENRPLQMKAAIGSGAGATVARENEWGQLGSMAAQMAGAVAVPGGFRAARYVAEPFVDAGATIGAAFGKEAGIRHVTSDAAGRMMRRVPEADRPDIDIALRTASEYVPGAKPTVAEALAEQQMGQPRQVGGSFVRLQKDLTGAQGVEDVLPTVALKAQKATADARSALNAKTGPMRDAVLDDINTTQGGISSRRLAQRLDDLANDPQYAGRQQSRKAILAARRELDTLQSGGKVNARTIYEMRKTMWKTIEKSFGDKADRDVMQQAHINRQIQKAIDETIVEAGGKKWQAYLDTHAEGMRAVDKQAARLQKVDEIAETVKAKQGTDLAGTEAPQPPTLLYRPAMFLNWGLKLIAKDANDPVVKEMARLLQNPGEFAEVLARSAKDPLRVRVQEVMNRGAVAAALMEQSNGP